MTPPSSADDNASSVRAAVSSGKHDTVLATSSVEMPHSQARKRTLPLSQPPRKLQANIYITKRSLPFYLPAR